MDPPTRWVLNVVDGLPFCVTDRVALLGDSVRRHLYAPTKRLRLMPTT